MSGKSFAWAAALASCALGVGGAACSTGSSDGGRECDAVCAGVPDCGQTTCLSQCVTSEAQCAVAGESSAFQAWTSCHPNFACVNGTYQATNCARESTEIASCGVDLTGTTGDDGGHPKPRDGGGSANHDGSTASVDGAVDSGKLRDVGAGADMGAPDATSPDEDDGAVADSTPPPREDASPSDATSHPEDSSPLSDATSHLDSSPILDAASHLDSSPSADATPPPPPTGCPAGVTVIAMASTGSSGSFRTTNSVCVTYMGTLTGWSASNVEGRSVTVVGATTQMFTVSGDLVASERAPLPGADGYIYWIWTSGTEAFSSMSIL